MDITDIQIYDGPRWMQQQPPEDGYARLQEYKNDIVHLLAMGDTIMMSIAKKVEEIAEEGLYRYDENPDTQKPYRSMREYMPALLDELRARARLHKLSKRQVQEYIALYKVFVKNLGLTEGEIMQLGPSHFTEIREAIDYDHDTGQVRSDQEAKDGKIGAETALRVIEELRESGGEVRVKDLREALDEERGITRRFLKLQWACRVNDIGDEVYQLRAIYTVENGEERALIAAAASAGMDREEAEWVTRRMGALSNLDEI